MWCAYVKNIKGHNADHGCDKCVQDGVWEGKVTFPLVNSPVRTDADFDEMTDKDHHLQATLSPLCNLSLGMVSRFPHDPMHLVYLGVVKRLLLSWTKGSVWIDVALVRIMSARSRNVFLLVIDIYRDSFPVNVDHYCASATATRRHAAGKTQSSCRPRCVCSLWHHSCKQVSCSLPCQ